MVVRKKTVLLLATYEQGRSGGGFKVPETFFNKQACQNCCSCAATRELFPHTEPDNFGIYTGGTVAA